MSDSTMNILLLVPGFPADEQDKSCIPALQNYVAALAAQSQVSLTVIALQYPFQRGEYRWQGCRVYACAGRNRGGPARRLNWISAANNAKKYHRSRPFDLIHSFWLSETAHIGQKLSRAWNIPHIATIMGQDARAENRYIKSLDFSRLHLSAGSQYVAAIFREAAGHAVDQLIPLGLDKGHIDEISASDSGSIDILGVGALTSLKNYSLFLECIATLVEEFPHLKAVLVGDGPEKDRLEKLIVKKHLQQNLRLTGELPRPEVLAMMKQSAIFLHPSMYESQGYVLYEALYCGMIPVSFEVGIAAETDGIRTCQSRDDMLNVLRILLKRPPAAPSAAVPAITETVEKFLQFYADCLQR